VARVVPCAEPVFDESERNLVERGRPRGDSPPPRGGSGAGHEGARAAEPLDASGAEPLDASAPRGGPQSLRQLCGARALREAWRGASSPAKNSLGEATPDSRSALGVRRSSERPERGGGGSTKRLRRRRGTQGVSRVARVVPCAEPVFDESERNLVQRGRPRGDSPPPRGGSGAGHEGAQRERRGSRRCAKGAARVTKGERKHRGPPQPGRAAWIHVGVEVPQPFAAAAFSLAFLAKAVRLSALARRVDLRPFTCGPSSPPTSCSTTRSVASPRRRLSSFTMRV